MSTTKPVPRRLDPLGAGSGIHKGFGGGWFNRPGASPRGGVTG